MSDSVELSLLKFPVAHIKSAVYVRARQNFSCIIHTEHIHTKNTSLYIWNDEEMATFHDSQNFYRWQINLNLIEFHFQPKTFGSSHKDAIAFAMPKFVLTIKLHNITFTTFD